MLGFGKKNIPQPTPVVPDEGLRIHTIPKAFYGKIVVEEKKVEPAAPARPAQVPSTGVPVQKIIIPPGQQAAATVPAAHAPRHEATAQSKKKWIFVGTGVLLVLLVAGAATWYYTKGFSFNQPPALPTPQPVVVEDQPQPAPVVADPVVVETPPSVTSASTGLRVIPPYVDTIDFDTDSLTDVEEELYKSDMAAPDSDADGYHDGLEVVNLYDPVVAAPSAMVSSSNAAAYINTMRGYSILHPQDWFAAAVDESTKDEVLFTSRTGEFMSLRHFALQPGETFVSWFGTNVPDVRFESLITWKNRMGVSGWYESNGMRFYFADSDSVFVLQYEPGVRTAINFRTSLRMMAESFAFVSATAVAPPAPLPGIQDVPPATPAGEAAPAAASPAPVVNSSESEAAPVSEETSTTAPSPATPAQPPLVTSQ